MLPPYECHDGVVALRRATSARAERAALFGGKIVERAVNCYPLARPRAAPPKMGKKGPPMPGPLN